MAHRIIQGTNQSGLQDFTRGGQTTLHTIRQPPFPAAKPIGGGAGVGGGLIGELS